jgi:lipoyl(octanoyl) transferase
VATDQTAWLLRPERPVPYGTAFEWMHDLAERRLRDEVPDSLILLEHPPVFTAGRRADPAHVRWARDQIEAAGAEYRDVDRGGSVTFHGPGQLVGYPIVDLGVRPDVQGYVWKLEETVIRAAADAGVDGLRRNPLNAGVWAEDRKVCAIGVRVMAKRVTLHGFALNCTTDLRWYDAIVPCGLTDTGVTTLSNLAGREVTVEEMASAVAHRFQEVFGLRLGARQDVLVAAASDSSA